MAKESNSKRLIVVMFVGMLVELLLQWMLHVKVIFVGDDLWYATNLATGEAIEDIADIWESQKWHFFNWGGRSVIHFLLQLIIMFGETIANILNVAVTLLLCLIISETAGKRNLKSFCLAFFLLISLNPNVLYTMFWQSGCVNYLYASTWILLFIMLYLRKVKNPDASEIWGISFWIVPLGFVTGWSNENMGPASFMLTMLVLLYWWRVLKRRPPMWMWMGAGASFIGSVLVVMAPGNFVRSALVEKQGTFMTLYQKLVMMMKAGADFLFPVCLFLLVSLLIYLKTGNRLHPFQIMLMITAILAFGAMILSPTFPNRATFGILVLCITAIISFLEGIEASDSKSDKYVLGFIVCMWLIGMYTLAIELQAPLSI